MQGVGAPDTCIVKGSCTSAIFLKLCFGTLSEKCLSVFWDLGGRGLFLLYLPHLGGGWLPKSVS